MINTAHLLGRIGNKSVKDLPSGNKLCTISIVTNRRYIDQNGKNAEADTWHTVYLYNKLAEIVINNTNIGDLIYITGEINHTKKESPDGTHKYFYSVNAKEIKLLPRAIQPQRKQDDDINGNKIDEGVTF